MPNVLVTRTPSGALLISNKRIEEGRVMGQDIFIPREEVDAFRAALAVVDGPESEAIKRREERQRKENEHDNA
jgi:hypothetical protein